MVLISVVIPTRGRDESLAACLALLAPGVQTMAADLYEVIISDDGTTATAETMIAEQFPWAHWTAGPKQGPAANRNHGASMARGEWIAFTDDDCLPSPDWLAAFAAATEGVDVLEGRTTCALGVASLLYEAPINLDGGNLWSCNFAITRNAFARSGGFDARFPHAAAEDIEFHARLRRVGCSIKFVAAAVVDHPPRPRRLGVAAGRAWEGRVLLAVLEPSSLPQPLLVHVAKLRMKQLLASRSVVVAARFAWSSVVEWLTVAALCRRWQQRYNGVRPLTAHQARVVLTSSV